MDGETLIAATRDGLFQPEAGLWIAPVRHHSPACAWAVGAMIREIRPAEVLIEAPHDFDPLIPHLLDPGTVPPVAVVSLSDDSAGWRLSGYYPFCAHSPEWVALHAGREVGATVRFIDLGSGEKMALRDGAAAGTPVPLLEEGAFDSGAYVRGLSERLGCRDGYELWDHLFETRIGTADWRGFLQSVGTYCAAIRAATPETEIVSADDAAREVHMAACLAARSGPAVAVVGGFHAAALIDPVKTAGAVTPRRKSAAQAYLIRYGFAQLDALMGYAAGLPQPAWYDMLWDRALAAGGPPEWGDLAHGAVADFATRMRDEGHAIPVPAQVELLRSAGTLARLRGRPGPLRHDLIDGVRSALLKGEATGGDAWTERIVRHLRGTRIGEVSAGAGQPPLVADAMRRARAHRFDLSDGVPRSRDLDIRRKPPHLAASRFAHAMALLDSGFAERTAGPDFVLGIDTGRLIESWRYAWGPGVEGALIEAARHGDTVPSACLARIAALRAALADDGRADDLPPLVSLFRRGLLAGLGAALSDHLDAISAALMRTGDFAGTAETVQAMHAIEQSRGPLSLDDGLDVAGTMQAAFDRTIRLCDTLPDARDDALDPALGALRLMTDLLRRAGRDRFDADRFDAALDRVDRPGTPPDIRGAIAAIAVGTGRRDPDALSRMLTGAFDGSGTPEERLGPLRGVLRIAPSLLWTAEGALEAVDAFLAGLDPDAFLFILPHLRLALTALSPRETDRVADLLARRHGVGAGSFLATHDDVDEATAARGAEIDRRLRDGLVADGLTGWIG